MEALNKKTEDWDREIDEEEERKKQQYRLYHIQYYFKMRATLTKIVLYLIGTESHIL